jgi:hypothetical protein
MVCRLEVSDSKLLAFKLVDTLLVYTPIIPTTHNNFLSLSLSLLFLL